ncbi:MAG: (4Fe-4S)-binding protein [Methylosarcina sp.]
MQVTWDETKCCHAGVCVSLLPRVFRIKDDQFVIEPGNASKEEILQVVDQCPSGALQVPENNTGRSS